MPKRLIWSLAATVALVLSGFAGARTIWGAQAAPSLVQTATAHILVNAQGMTLYLFAPDKHNKSVCTAAAPRTGRPCCCPPAPRRRPRCRAWAAASAWRRAPMGAGS